MSFSSSLLCQLPVYFLLLFVSSTPLLVVFVNLLLINSHLFAALSKRLSEQKAEFEAYRDKLIAGYQEDKLALDKVSGVPFFFFFFFFFFFCFVLFCSQALFSNNYKLIATSVTK